MRPNAIPAKDFYKNDAAQQHIENRKRTMRGGMRHCIEDYCDFCKRVVYVQRSQLGLRIKGYRFGCWVCHENGVFKWKSEGGNDKVLPTQRGAGGVRESIKS